MDGVAISIIGRPRPLPGHDTPNAAHNTYTLKCEEPVIPLRLLQTLNSHRWNCNVLGSTRKMTAGNYVRLLFGQVLRSRCEPCGPTLEARGALLGQARLTPAFASPSCRTLRAARTCAARRTSQAQRKWGPAPADPRLSLSYSWSSPRPRGVIWGHSRSMFASLPCLRRYFSKSSAQSWCAWSW